MPACAGMTAAWPAIACLDAVGLRQIRLDDGLELCAYACDLRWIDTHRHAQTPARGHGFVEHLRVAVEPACARPIARVECEFHHDARLGQSLLDQVEQAIGPLPGRGRDQNGTTPRR